MLSSVAQTKEDLATLVIEFPGLTIEVDETNSCVIMRCKSVQMMEDCLDRVYNDFHVPNNVRVLASCK